MAYLVAKQLHVTFVALSFIGFFARGVMMLLDSSLRNTRLIRIGPHVIDTLLLLSAVYLAYVVLQTQGRHLWLLSKLIGLVLYVGLGVVALKRGRTKTVRFMVWLLALAVFAWIASVAFSKNPWGFFSGAM
ncbi:MAG: SirB2 family protein [Burkholderiaceae bacterium]